MKGLLVGIYRSHLKDSGTLCKAERAILVGEGIPGLFEPDDNAPGLKLICRKGLRSDGRDGRDYLHAEPIGKWCGEGAGPMFGGAFIYTSDSRFPSDQPIPIHDRWESATDYRTYNP